MSSTLRLGSSARRCPRLGSLAAMTGLLLGLVGCSEENEKSALKDPTTNSVAAPGVVPPGTPRSSADFAKRTGAANPMMSDPMYKSSPSAAFATAGVQGFEGANTEAY